MKCFCDTVMVNFLTEQKTLTINENISNLLDKLQDYLYFKKQTKKKKKKNDFKTVKIQNTIWKNVFLINTTKD